MSLDYKLSKIANYKELLATEGERKGGPNVMLETLIFSCMAVGMGEIKNEADAVEFYSRLSFFEKTGSALRSKATGEGIEPVYFTLDEVKRCIGLSTNVFPKESSAKFAKRVFENYARDVSYANRKKEAA